MIFNLIAGYALARGLVKAAVEPRGDISDILAWLRTVYPPPYRVREVTEAEFRQIHGWPEPSQVQALCLRQEQRKGS